MPDTDYLETPESVLEIIPALGDEVPPDDVPAVEPAISATNRTSTTEGSRPHVALLADSESLSRFARETGGGEPRFEVVVQYAQSLGLLVSARCFGEWADIQARTAAYAAGLETVFSPTLRTAADPNGKRLVGSQIVVEGMDLLWMKAADIMVLATHDKDVAPLVVAALRRDVHVVLIAGPGTSPLLREVSERIVLYSELVAAPGNREAVPLDVDRSVVTASPAASSTARPRRAGTSRRRRSAAPATDDGARL